MRRSLRPSVSWRFSDLEAPFRFLDSLDYERWVLLEDEEYDDPMTLPIENAMILIRHWREEGRRGFQLTDLRESWSVGVLWDGGWLSLYGLMASWRPEDGDFWFHSIDSRGKGARERIPWGLPALAYLSTYEDPRTVAVINRAKPAGRLGYFRARIREEVWVEGNRVAALSGFLGHAERPLGGEEFRAWVEEDPDALVDVQPGNVGENLLPRREVLTMIWKSIRET